MGVDVPCMATFRELHKQVQGLATGTGDGGSTSGGGLHAQELHALQEQVKELLGRAPAEPAAPAPGTRVHEALARELAALGPIVKVEGIVEHREGQSELQLCAAAAQALSSKIGGGARSWCSLHAG